MKEFKMKESSSIFIILILMLGMINILPQVCGDQAHVEQVLTPPDTSSPNGDTTAGDTLAFAPPQGFFGFLIIFIIIGSVLTTIFLCVMIYYSKKKRNSSMTKPTRESDKKIIPEFSPVPHDEAQNILRSRYAKGEITKEQYGQMKKDLAN